MILPRRAVVGLALAAGACAWFQGPPVPAHRQDGVLVDESGRSLYTFDRDVPYGGQSRCVDPVCTQRFPAFTAPAGAHRVREFALIARPDGSRQWVYQGRPLYRYSGDAQTGDRAGDALDNLWRLARP